MKKIFSVLALLFLSVILIACGGNEDTGVKTVKLTLWASELEEDLSNELIAQFVEQYKDEAKLEVTYNPQSESNAADSILADLEAAADVFVYASDQFDRLYTAGALQEVVENTANVIAANGGVDNGIIKGATVNGKLYSYPLSADNGYFLYYDKTKYT